MDRLTSMAVFVKAVDVGSFAAAADALEMSGPMVGKHVRFLEERLGVRLLNRTTRRQSLTETGQAYTSAAALCSLKPWPPTPSLPMNCPSRVAGSA